MVRPLTTKRKGKATKFRKVCLLVSLATLFFIPTYAFGAAYYYCSKEAAGSHDGSSWANCWDCEDGDSDEVNWSTLETAAASQPVYLFMDGGTTSQTYNGMMVVDASGSSDTNRVYIMPGYAAQQMGVPGSHDSHAGKVVWDLQGIAESDAIQIRWEKYVTLDGYADPRPSGGNNPKLVVGWSNDPGGSLVNIHDSEYIHIRNVEVTHEDHESYRGNGIGGGKESGSALRQGNICEYCYVHDTGNGVVNDHGINFEGQNGAIIRYNEMRNVGDGGSEVIGCSGQGSQDCEAYYNLVVDSALAFIDIAVVRFNTVYIPSDAENTVRAYTTRNGEVGSSAIYIENNFFYDLRSTT
ncbi:MAG: hypothetical protein ACFFCW_26465, partial [Candidatus Hodarchaeota archaeon]